MRIRTLAIAASACLILGGGLLFASLDKETRSLLATLPTDRDLLSWKQNQRDAAFRAMDRLSLLAKWSEIAPSPTPSALPAGEPLVIPGIDEFMADQRTAGLVIIHDGKIRFERYGLDFDAAGRWTSFSVAKSFTSTLVGAAIQDGAIRSLEDTVSRYIPDLRGSVYDEVTIRQLLTMSSGVQWNEDYEDPNADVARFNNAKPEPGMDATVSYMRTLSRAHPAGEVWNYNTGETNLVGVLVSSATGKPLAQYLQEKIWNPAGMEAAATWLLSKTGHEIAGCCMQAATRDFARFGLFVLANGNVGGKQIVPADWFSEAIRKQKEIGEPGRGYGFQWWTYDDGAVSARGIFGQGIFIDPARRLVIATHSSWPRASLGPQPEAREAFYAQVQALIDAEPRRAVVPVAALPESSRKAVFILLDGIPADVIERVATPMLDEIAAAGGYRRASVGGELGGATETPTVSAPGYMSLLTGTWANKHNVRGNSNQSPNYEYWNLFRAVETMQPARRTALFSTWTENRTVLIGLGRPGAGDFQIDHVVDGFELDTIAYPHDRQSAYILAIDERVSSEAAAHIAAVGPDLSWIYLQHTDDMGHAHGDSERFDAAVQQADAQVGRIWRAVQQRQALGEEWMIVVTTDHGRDAATGRGHGRQSERERTTWIVTNRGELSERFTRGTPAIVDIAPSILQHLGVVVPEKVVREVEGVSFLRAP